MNGHMLPTIERLADAETNADRAKWMLSQPTFILATYQVQIRAILRRAGYLPALQVLELEFAVSSAVRNPRTGEPPQDLMDALRAARLRLVPESIRRPAESAE